jgi:hypothetical protein
VLSAEKTTTKRERERVVSPMNYTLAHFLDFLHNRFEIRIKSGYSFGAMERK